MSQWVRTGLYSAYYKIAEPRVVRIIQFWIYVGMLSAGALILISVPRSLENVVGHGFVVMFACFLILGSAFAAFAVLPGIWWLERTGLALLGTGLMMYLAIIIYLNSSPVGIAVSSIIILTLVQRWLEIKGSQLAPLVPNK